MHPIVQFPERIVGKLPASARSFLPWERADGGDLRVSASTARSGSQSSPQKAATMRILPLSLWILSSTHVVTAPSPAHGSSPKPPFGTSWKRCRHTNPVFTRVVPFSWRQKIVISRPAGGHPGLRKLPDQVNASAHTPLLPLGSNHWDQPPGISPLGEKTTRMAVQPFGGGQRRRVALFPPPKGHGSDKKYNTINQRASACGGS